MTTLATVRANLKTAITSNSNYSVVDFGAEVITTRRVNYILELVVAPNSNPGALTQLETMVAAVLPLIPQSWQIQNVSSPRISQANTNDVYLVEISITTIYNP